MSWLPQESLWALLGKRYDQPCLTKRAGGPTHTCTAKGNNCLCYRRQAEDVYMRQVMVQGQIILLQAKPAQRALSSSIMQDLWKGNRVLSLREATITTYGIRWGRVAPYRIPLCLRAGIMDASCFASPTQTTCVCSMCRTKSILWGPQHRHNPLCGEPGKPLQRA